MTGKIRNNHCYEYIEDLYEIAESIIKPSAGDEEKKHIDGIIKNHRKEVIDFLKEKYPEDFV